MAGLAARPAAGGTPLYFPAGSRLGIRKPDELEPLADDTRNLMSSDFTFQVMFWETLALGGGADRDIWNDRPRTVTLLSEQTLSGGEQRRVFEHSDFAGNADHSWFTFVVRTNDAEGRPEWFSRLFLVTKPMLESTGARARWRETIEAIVASATLRSALSVAEMLAEHGIAMDLAGLHPHHFGDKLIVSLAPPETPGARWTNDCYIAMEAPPARLFQNEDSAPDEAAATIAAYQASFRAITPRPHAEWTSNGIDWIVAGEWQIAGIDTHVREVQGVGHGRVIKLKSYCRRSDRAGIGAALERVAHSLVVLPRS